MKRFLAIVGVVAFIAACSDSSTAPSSQLKPTAASRDAGDPPPPPLSGSGDGFLDLGGGDAVPAVVPNEPPDPCLSGIHVRLSYAFSYLQNNPGSNQVSHMQLDGTNGLTGEIDVHQNENGKSNAHGHVTDGVSFAFDIQDGTENEFTPFGFDFSIDAIVTNLVTGQKCSLSGDVSGNFGDS